MKKQLTKTHKKILYVISLLIFILFSGVIMYYVGRPLINFVSEPELFRIWVEDHGFLGKCAFVGMIILQVVIAIIPGEPFEIGAGYAFGIFEGVVLSILGFVLGSAIIFFVIKKIGEDLLDIFFSSEKTKKLKFLIHSKKSANVMFWFFFIPGTPKDLITYISALTPIRFNDFIFLVTVARFPSVITSVILGDALGTKDYTVAIWVFIITTVLSVAGGLLYNKLCFKLSKK